MTPYTTIKVTDAATKTRVKQLKADMGTKTNAEVVRMAIKHLHDKYCKEKQP